MQKGPVEGITPFGIRCPGDHPPYLTPKQGPSAHNAGFEGHIEGAFIQVFGAKVVGRRGDGLHFGVCSGIVQLLAAVMTARNDFVLVDDDRSHRDFTHPVGLSGQAQGLFHEIFIAIGNEHSSKIGPRPTRGEALWARKFYFCALHT